MFRFKQFSVEDNHSAMKVGTDGVLLGAWADVEGDMRILDVGTGSGLIALMVAQRNSCAEITAVDIDGGAVEDARHNVAQSPWGRRVEVVHGDVKSLDADIRFDHIVTNPPYFDGALLSPDAERSVARHTCALTYRDIVDVACELLREEGRLSIVLPMDCAAHFRREAFGRLHLVREIDVVTRHGEAPKRALMEFRNGGMLVMPRCGVMSIYGDDGSYSDEYRALTEDFYLKF